MSDHRPSEDLLESSHSLPRGLSDQGHRDHHQRIRASARSRTVVDSLPAAASDLDYSVRTTPGGRHVSLTLEVSVQTADQVRVIYSRLRELEGITLLF